MTLLTQDEEPSSEAPLPADESEHAPEIRFTRSGRRSTSYVEPVWEDEEDVAPRARARAPRSLRGFVADDDDDEVDEDADFGETMQTRRAAARADRRDALRSLAAERSTRHRRSSRTRRRPSPAHDPISDGLDDTPSSGESEHGEETSRAYSFRTRKKINYSMVNPPPEPPRDGFGRRVRRATSRPSQAYELPPRADPYVASLPYTSLPRGLRGKQGWDSMPRNMSGKDYAHAFGEADDSSEDEVPRTLGAAASIGGGAGALLESGPSPASAGLGTATDSFGRVKRDGDRLADVDPLGVDMDIDFGHVGGLENHVQQLKEMVALPLLYPDLFQRFGVTPPRGVLFHGPPGTGKTLVARALAASCGSSGQKVSFFMRKGADCLSKWVGEAERQLRLLFEEAKNSQPSIIFFDEIDGLAPVRSSKQDQIHASIVSTLLALMDGMDGRGQVVVIGATNRPDSIDPALRRPGRFDREFYFPLPNKAARSQILSIHTQRWDPPLDAGLKEVLAEATNGFGGADLRVRRVTNPGAVYRGHPECHPAALSADLCVAGPAVD